MRYEDEPVTPGGLEEASQRLVESWSRTGEETRAHITELMDRYGRAKFPPQIDPDVAVELLTQFSTDASNLGIYEGAILTYTEPNHLSLAGRFILVEFTT